MRLRVLHMDESLMAQPAFLKACGKRVQQLDLRAEGRQLRMWASRKNIKKFIQKLDQNDGQDNSPTISFMGSGDFHHLTAALVERLHGPLTVIHLDNHPDFVRLAIPYHCASWVNRILDLPNVNRVITVGPCTDLTAPQFSLGNLAALTSGRLELYPYRHGPSLVWGNFGKGPSHQQIGGYIHWRNAGDEDWNTFWVELLSRISTPNVYVSIDKDVLNSDAAMTNWDQGKMHLEQLLEALRLIVERCNIIGADVVGDYSPASECNLVHRISAWLDHPHINVNASTAAQLNTYSNTAIVEAIHGIQGMCPSNRKPAS